MLSKDSAPTPQPAPPLPEAKADAEVAVLNPWDPVEGASEGSSPVNDPAATDTRPPGYEDLELFL